MDQQSQAYGYAPWRSQSGQALGPYDRVHSTQAWERAVNPEQGPQHPGPALPIHDTPAIVSGMVDQFSHIHPGPFHTGDQASSPPFKAGPAQPPHQLQHPGQLQSQSTWEEQGQWVSQNPSQWSTSDQQWHSQDAAITSNPYVLQGQLQTQHQGQLQAQQQGQPQAQQQGLQSTPPAQPPTQWKGQHTWGHPPQAQAASSGKADQGNTQAGKHVHTGNRPVTPGMPSHFVPTSDMLDSKPGNYNGYPLYRRVVDNSTSRKLGIAGVDIAQVPLVNCLHFGWQDQFLRKLSAGDTIALVPCDGAAEAVLLQRILSLLRARKITGHALDQAVQQAYYCKYPTVQSTYNVAAGTVAEPLARQISDLILGLHQQALEASASAAPATGQQTADPAATQRIADLERKLRQNGVPLTPTKPKLGEATESQDAKQQEEQPPAQTAMQSVLHPDCSKRPLDSVDCPVTNPACAKYLRDYKNSLAPNQQSQFDLHMEYISKAWSELKPKPDIRNVAVKWGLPFSLASALSQPNLLKLAAVAAFKSA